MVENVADHLDLRQNQPTSRRGQVDRHTQYGNIAGLQQIADDGLVVPAGRGMPDHGDFQFTNAVALLGADRHRGSRRQLGFETFQRVRRRCLQIGFIEYQNERDILRPAFLCQFTLRTGDAGGCVDDKQNQISFAQYFQRFFDAQLAQFADVIQASGIDYDHRAERQNFHRFVNRVGGSAGNGGDDRQRLIGQGVDQAGLAGVAATEQSDMQAVATRCFIHGRPPSVWRRSVVLPSPDGSGLPVAANCRVLRP